MSIERVLGTFLWKNHAKNVLQKLVPGSYLILVYKIKQPLHERGLSKALTNLTLFFLSNPIPFDGQDNKKQKMPGTSDQSLFRLQNKFGKFSLLVMYFLIKEFDDVI